MKGHASNAELAVILAKTVANCKPYELRQVMDALKRLGNWTRTSDENAGAGESTITTIIGSLEP